MKPRERESLNVESVYHFFETSLFIHRGMLNSGDQDFLNVLEDTHPLDLGDVLSFG